MFTVCPKCALTLVVTATDLRVAQGYVRCGRCSNVFNAIVGLSEDRSGGTGAVAGTGQTSTASTSIIRKAPSISDDDPPHDPIADTGENEPIYAEPEGGKNTIEMQDVFVEAPAPLARGAAPKTAPSAAAVVKILTPPAPRSPPPGPPEPTYSDSTPDMSLEFNAEETDVSKVFVETPAKKLDMRQITGTFEQLKPENVSPPPARKPAPPPRDEEDEQLEDELRTLAARLDATGKHAALTPEAIAKHTAPRTERPAPKLDAANDRSGTYSPYNSADSPTNVARKAAAGAARRAGSNNSGARASTATDSREFNASPADEAGATAAAAELAPRPPSRKKQLAWIGGGIALILALGAQAIHHNRNDLATNSRLNRPLTRFYAALGVPLVPRWNLASYDVRQLGAFSAAGDNGNLTVRASLKNSADQPLPLPLLRITVQDRYGNRIATRDVPPQGYVPGVVPEGAHLGVGQRIDAEMTFKDPGRDAVGFEIDACLPTPEGRIGCANDTAAVRR